MPITLHINKHGKIIESVEYVMACGEAKRIDGELVVCLLPPNHEARYLSPEAPVLHNYAIWHEGYGNTWRDEIATYPH